MSRALILGGSGAVGRALAVQLLAAGWQVDITGRNPARFDADVAQLGACFYVSDRRETKELQEVVGEGVDLLVDCVCYTAAEARQLIPLAHNSTSVVVLSSKAVYVDRNGAHANLGEPAFDGPIRETQPVMAPSVSNFDSAEGYGANKVAMENALLESGLPISILRPSKIHGPGAMRPRHWVFVKRILDRRPFLLLANAGRSVESPTAAVNLAALIQVVASQPAQRILNAADPDAPDVRTIARIVAERMGHEWREVLLDENAPKELGRMPWHHRNPVILDTTAALAVGYRPVGTFAATVIEEIDWLVKHASESHHLPATLDTAFFDRSFDYEREDAYLKEQGFLS